MPTAARPSNARRTRSLRFSALQHGVYGIDLDVHWPKDVIPLVIHDATVDRTIAGTGAVSQMTLAELQALDAGTGSSIATLADVLECVASRCYFDIEVKAAAAADAVVREASQRPGLRWAMSCRP